jgi:uncharacterized membrane protein YhfC
MDSILILTYPINFLLMIAIPVMLGFYLTRKFKLGWRLWWIGSATFVLSQLGHIPFNLLLTNLFQGGILPSPPETYKLAFNALLLGLSAGLWEECTRYAAYRWWAKDARSWSNAILMGAGHGGIEAIILGLLALIAFIQMLALRNADLTALIPAEQLEIAQYQIATYWSSLWYATFLGAIERVFALTAQVTLSVIVLQVFTRKQIRWLWIAIGWHAFIDAVAIYILNTWGAYFAEGVLAVITLINIALIFILRKPEPKPQGESRLAPLPKEITLSDIQDIDSSSETLEQTRYN